MAKIKEKKPVAAVAAHQKDKDALIHMGYAPKIDEDMHTAQMLPAAFFTAFVIIITRMHVYKRDMGQFFWSGQGDNAQLSDFFSYFKMVAIVICATLAILFLLYRMFTQALYIQKSVYYYPMMVYSLFVLLSYAFADSSILSIVHLLHDYRQGRPHLQEINLGPAVWLGRVESDCLSVIWRPDGHGCGCLSRCHRAE